MDPKSKLMWVSFWWSGRFHLSAVYDKACIEQHQQDMCSTEIGRYAQNALSIIGWNVNIISLCDHFKSSKIHLNTYNVFIFIFFLKLKLTIFMIYNWLGETIPKPIWLSNIDGFGSAHIAIR